VDVDAIRRQHNIADVVSSYGIELRRSGAALVGRCPFHQDRGRPNLHVYASGRWICYRCDERGDAIGFVQRVENVGFLEAVERLAGGTVQSPVPRKGSGPSRPRAVKRIHRRDDRDEHSVVAAAADLYANRLLQHDRALDYMAERGFERPLLERYQVGYAAGDELIPYLRWRRLPLAAAIRAGLITADGHEFLAGRVVFPEIDADHTAWLIGRILPETRRVEPLEAPVYLGLPGRKPLLGWTEAVGHARHVCLVEGVMDLMALRQWRISGLAIAGTGVHADKLEQLKRFDRVYLALDSDQAGRDGTDRIALQLGRRAIRVGLPLGVKDVAELARIADGEQQFRAALSGATDRALSRAA
jgi:DNA primase